MKDITLPIEGMTCASCVARVEKTLKKNSGVEEAVANLVSEKVTIRYDDNKVSLENLAEILHKNGYDLILPDDSKKQTLSITETQRKNFLSAKKDFLISLVFAFPVMMISMISMNEEFMKGNSIDVQEVNYLLFVLTSFVMVFGGRKFFTIAGRLAKHLQSDMNTLIALGTGTAYLWSSFVTFFPSLLPKGITSNSVYFDTASTIITLILLGRMLESRSKSKAADSISLLIGLQPKTAVVIFNGEEKIVPINRVYRGDIVLIRPGDKIPVDGEVIFGETTVDESMLTGESFPVNKKIGNNVSAGSINLDGSVRIKATAVGSKTLLSQIIELVEKAQGSKAPIQNLADKISSIFVPLVIAIAITTFLIWFFVAGENLPVSLIHMIAVLIIACPCALGLATPTSILVGSGLAARNGILIKNAESLEKLKNITTIVFDKTGTITKGELTVKKFINVSSLPDAEILSQISSIENLSTHPIAKAITKFSKNFSNKLIDVEEFQYYSGKGIRGKINHNEWIIGTKNFIEEHCENIELSDDTIKTINGFSSTIIIAVLNKKLSAIFLISDEIRNESKELIKEMKELKIKTVLLSGDSKIVTEQIAKETGIENFYAEVLPAGKAKVINDLKNENEVVAMVGDGINDAPSLAAADVGIAVGSGTDIAIETSDITLLKNDLMLILKGIKISKETVKTIKQNLFWAFIYNTIGIPIAAIGLLNPMFAAAAMAFSSVSVISNSLRLRNKKI